MEWEYLTEYHKFSVKKSGTETGRMNMENAVGQNKLRPMAFARNQIW